MPLKTDTSISHCTNTLSKIFHLHISPYSFHWGVADL